MDGKKKKEKYDNEIKYKHICTYCDYRTNKTYNYNKHIETRNHKMIMNISELYDKIHKKKL